MRPARRSRPGHRPFIPGSSAAHAPMFSLSAEHVGRAKEGVAEPMADSKTARRIYQDIVEDGRMNLDRASVGLAFSGLTAGLNLSFGAVAMFSVAAITGEVGLAAIASYPIGFLIVVLGRAQLFTETTVIPVTVVLKEWRRSPSCVLNMLRLWAVVLAANLLGALAAATAITFTRVLDDRAFELFLEEVHYKMENGFVEMLLFAVYGGWVVALMAWLVAAARDTMGRAFVIWVTAILIPAGSLPHSVAGSLEVLVGVLSNRVSWGDYLGGFLLPVVTGNALGGVVFVTLLNYGQVVGSDKKTSFAKYLDRRLRPEKKGVEERDV